MNSPINSQLNPIPDEDKYDYSSSSSQLNYEENENNLLKDENKELKNLIDVQEKIIKQLENKSKELELMVQTNINNEKIVEKVIKFIKIFYGLTEIGYSFTNVIIYGNFFNNFFAKKSLQDTKLYFFLQYLDEHIIRQFLDRLYEMDYIINNNYHNKKTGYINQNFDIISINLWELKIKITDDFILDVTIHDTNYLNDILFNCQNLILSKQGFIIKQLTDTDKEKKNKHTSMAIFDIFNNLLNEKVEISKIFNNFENSYEKSKIFDIIEKQNEYVKNNFKIKKGFSNNYSLNNESCNICYNNNNPENNSYLYNLKCNHIFCSSCLYKSTSYEENTNHLKCPMCRQKIEMKLN